MSKILTIDAPTVIAGLKFYAKVYGTPDTRSFSRHLTRLKKHLVTCYIDKHTWGSLTDPQRLARLMAWGDCKYRVEDRTVYLLRTSTAVPEAPQWQRKAEPEDLPF